MSKPPLSPSLLTEVRAAIALKTITGFRRVGEFLNDALGERVEYGKGELFAVAEQLGDRNMEPLLSRCRRLHRLWTAEDAARGDTKGLAWRHVVNLMPFDNKAESMAEQGKQKEATALVKMRRKLVSEYPEDPTGLSRWMERLERTKGQMVADQRESARCRSLVASRLYLRRRLHQATVRTRAVASSLPDSACPGCKDAAKQLENLERSLDAALAHAVRATAASA